MDIISFRPHHFMCSIGYQGYGYDANFINNFNMIIAILRGPEGNFVPIQVTFKTDSICQACPHQRGDLCVTQTKIQRLDVHHAAALGLKNKDIITYGEAKKRIRTHITDDVFKNICKDCEWQSSGLCQKALTDLRDSV